MKHAFQFFLAITLASCDPCSDCGQPLTSEPTVQMVFIYQDSIDVIDLVLVEYDSLDSAFTSIKSLLSDFRDSVERLDDSLALGLTEYQDEKDAMLDSILNRQVDSTFLADLGITDSISNLNSAKSSVNSGLVELTAINIAGFNTVPLDTNISESWTVPLSFEKEFSIYEILVQEETLVIELDYETFTEVDNERQIRVRAQNIQVVDAIGIDSLINCEQNCIDGETTFTFYF